MLKQLKMYSLRKVLVWVLVTLVGGAVFLAMRVPGVVMLAKGPAYLDDVPVEELEGKYVTADVEYILDWFAYTESSKGAVTEKEYIIPVGTQEFMALVLDGKMVEQGEALMNDTADYLNGGSDVEWYMQVQGTVRPLEGEHLRYFKEAFAYDELSPENQALVLPLGLYVGDVGAHDQVTMWFFFGIGLVLVAIGLFLVVKALTGGYQKSIKTYCQGDPMALEQLERFYEETPPVHGVRLGRDLLLVQQDAATILLEAQRVVWAYGQTVQHRTNGIPTGKTYALILRTDNGKMYTVPMKKDAVPEVLEAMHDAYPDWVMGYSKDLEDIYKQSPVELRERKRAAMAAATVPTVSGEDGEEMHEGEPAPSAEETPGEEE